MSCKVAPRKRLNLVLDEYNMASGGRVYMAQEKDNLSEIKRANFSEFNYENKSLR